MGQQDMSDSKSDRHGGGTDKAVQLDRLLVDLRALLEPLAAQHKYWEVRIHGSDGRARVEIIYQGATYNYRHGGEIVASRE